MWKKYNANPSGNAVGDCTVRAISKALGQSWETTYMGLCLQGLADYDMPSANEVWGRYLIGKGFTRKMVSDACRNLYNVVDFCEEHPTGTYILAISGHVICVIDGNHYDTWDSSKCIPLYYWERMTNDV